MNTSIVQNEMRFLCQTKNWKKLVSLIEDGYRGMFVMLRILHESDGKVVAGDLAKLMNVSTARIASALNTLEKKNYIKRESEANDARKVVIVLTEQGVIALEERKKNVQQMIAPMFENLTDTEIITLFSLLKKLLI